MQYIDNYNIFNESNSNNDNKQEEVKRSERLLNSAQKALGNIEPGNKKKSENLPTILFTDIVQSSKMWAELDSADMISMLDAHFKLVNELSEKNNGWVVKSIGDAYMVYFEPSEKSLENALLFSKELVKNEKKFKLRIGAFQGNVQERTYRIQKSDLKDFYGNVVNGASRLESKISGAPGVIAFSSVIPINKKMIDYISNNIGEVIEVNPKNYDLRGALIERAFKVKLI